MPVHVPFIAKSNRDPLGGFPAGLPWGHLWGHRHQTVPRWLPSHVCQVVLAIYGAPQSLQPIVLQASVGFFTRWCKCSKRTNPSVRVLSKPLFALYLLTVDDQSKSAWSSPASAWDRSAQGQSRSPGATDGTVYCKSSRKKSFSGRQNRETPAMLRCYKSLIRGNRACN